MKTLNTMSGSLVREAYAGPEADLWELLMGEQIHIGGFASSVELADRAGIGSGQSGVDLCCCAGAGMRFLLRFRNVSRMRGVDFCERMIERGRERTKSEGLEDCCEFILADARRTGLSDGAADFVWGEDAWCYVENKAELIAEAARLVRPGGAVVFTDWVEGDEMTDDEASRFLGFMKFPSLMDIPDYVGLLDARGLVVQTAENTGRFAPSIQLYRNILSIQYYYDALKILGFNREMLRALQEELLFIQVLADEKKLAQGIFIARKPE